MGFNSVKISNFRNLQEQEVDLSAPVVYLVGENGQGKTNFLELLYYLCYASSFRSRNEKSLIREGEDFFRLSGRFKHSEDFISSRIDVRFDQSGKRISLNGKTVSDRKDILNNMPCIVFCHNDLFFVNGNPEKKRLYMDQCLSLHDSSYINDLRQYKKILKERNFILKKSEISLLPVYTDQLVSIGLSIHKKREALIHYLNQSFSEYYQRVSGSDLDLSIQYDKSWKVSDHAQILEYVKGKESKELQYGLTLTGPHRDAFSIAHGESNFIDYASTGQIRIITLILRILQSEYYQMATGRNPVFLVDDVLLELDPSKRKRMMDLFPDHEQIFYTFLPGFINKSNESVLQFEVREGILERLDGKSE